ncbi:MAG: RNA 2',3'-cyclic phosphodiesterase [SAR202 cluster bacterium]|nr:RNA 2',3'-cyclic phosphodiesterase [SAR202 cluster bacterium]
MTTDAAPVRAFIAVDVSPAARQSLTALITELRKAIPRGVRWVEPDNIHLTLKFMAALEPRQVQQVLAALTVAVQGIQSFPLRLHALGAFPNGRQPRVIWAGLEGNLQELKRLQEQVEQEVAHLGLPQEHRPFSPHLTLGRVREDAPPEVRGRIGTALIATSLAAAAPWQVEEVRLVRSVLTPKGAVYTTLGSVTL